MYYKDNYIEIRLGLGLKEIKEVTPNLYNFVLSKINPDDTSTVVETFTSETGLKAFPVDGDYSLEVSSIDIPAYLVYLNINDSFITEFINQIKDIVCNCECKPCTDNENAPYSIKRQKMFNTTFILPNTIKQFSYGQVDTINSFLTNFIQLYFNETILDKKTELGKEYFAYYTTGTSSNNAKLFNTIITGTYYSLYYYYKKLILLNTEQAEESDIALYIKTVDDFFLIKELTTCLYCYIANIDFEALSLKAFNNDDNMLGNDFLVYYWQLTNRIDDINTVIPLITVNYLGIQPQDKFVNFEIGKVIVYTNIGRIVFAVTVTDVTPIKIFDEMGNNITAFFDTHYDAILKLQLYVSKDFQSYSNMFIRLER